MADSNIKSKCSDCIFFIEHDRMGECHRYPKVEQKFHSDFCGEYKQNQAAYWEEQKSFVKLFKKDKEANDISNPEINISVPPIFGEINFPEIKKRGRPAKK